MNGKIEFDRLRYRSFSYLGISMENSDDPSVPQFCFARIYFIHVYVCVPVCLYVHRVSESTNDVRRGCGIHWSLGHLGPTYLCADN